MLPRLKAWISLAEIKAALSWWKKDSVIKFENEFAKLSKQKHAIAFPYGRTGLFCLLKAMGLEGKEIICPAYTCVVVPHAIVTAGSIPVFVDSKEDDFNMDWSLMEQAVTENTGAVIATSIFGQPVNNEDVNLFREKFPDIYIIQDCAHSFFAGSKGEEVNLNCDAAFYGLNISKIMTSIFGGMVTVDNEILMEKIVEVREQYLVSPNIIKSIKRFIYLVAIWVAFNQVVYGWVNRLERAGVLDRFVKYFDEAVINMPVDYKVGLTEVEARVGILQCDKYREIVLHRKELAQFYSTRLAECKDLELPSNVEGHTYSHYVIKTDKADEIISGLLQKGYQLGELIDYFIPELPCYKNSRFYGDGIASCWPKNIINLPVHKDCSTEDADKICNYLLAFYSMQLKGSDG